MDMNDPMGMKQNKLPNYSTSNYSEVNPKKNPHLTNNQQQSDQNPSQFRPQAQYHSSTQIEECGMHERIEMYIQMTKLITEAMKEQRKWRDKEKKRRKMIIKKRKAKKAARILLPKKPTHEVEELIVPKSHKFTTKAFHVLKYPLISLIGGLGSCFIINKYYNTFGDTNPTVLMASVLLTAANTAKKMIH